MKNITIKVDLHSDEQIVCFILEKDIQPIEILKAKLNTRWSSTKKCWYLPVLQFNLSLALEALKGIAWVDISSLQHTTIEDQNQIGIQPEKGRFEKWLSFKRCNPNTSKPIPMLWLFFSITLTVSLFLNWPAAMWFY